MGALIPVYLSGLCRDKVRVIVAGTALLLALPLAHAQDATFSGSLTDSLSNNLASQGPQSGLSSSLLPEGTNLLTPSNRTGISDPLGFLIETGTLSPYPSGLGFADSYVQAQVQAQGLNDPILALRLQEYRNNRGLMAGAATASAPGARTAGAGMTAGGFSRRRMEGAGSTGAAAALAPFSAGSSALSAQSGAQAGFVDPNALLTGTPGTTGSGLTGMGTGTSAGFGGSIASASSGTIARAGFSSSDADLAADSGVLPMADSGGISGTTGVGSASTSTMGLIPDSGADAMPTGSAPGRVQPQVTLSTSSPTGFPDSTLGTAGSTSPEPPGISPLLWSTATAGSAVSSEVGGQGLSFLHPSLRGRTGLAPLRRSMPSVNEAGRRMRLQAMIQNPNATMPSAFTRRTMVRDYKRDREGGGQRRRPSHYGTGIGLTSGQQEKH